MKTPDEIAAEKAAKAEERKRKFEIQKAKQQTTSNRVKKFLQACSLDKKKLQTVLAQTRDTDNMNKLNPRLVAEYEHLFQQALLEMQDFRDKLEDGQHEQEIHMPLSTCST